MTRRSAYLLTWGIAFLALGIFLVEVQGQHTVWIAAFGLAGIGSIVGAISTPRIFDVLGFAALAMVSAARAVWFIIEYLTNSLVGDVFGIVIWVSVASAQVIVAGWPEPHVKIDLIYKRTDSGTD